MRIKKYLVVIVAMLALLTFGLAGCKPDEPAPVDPEQPEPPVVAVTLSQNTAELDVYETLTLTATKENTEEDIVWSTSDGGVASVADGVVTAIKAGTATITAAAGSASATCTVNVYNSYTAPVLRVDYDNVSISRGGEISVGVRTEWKGEAISEPVAYSWTLADGESDTVAAVTPSADGSSATVKGLEYGQTAYYVSAQVRGVNLVKKVAVKVCNLDITFEISNLTPAAGAFLADVALVETPDDQAEVTPDVKVYDKGEEVADAEIVWTCSDDTVVKIEGGVITALKEGEALLTGKYDNNDVAIKVNAYRPEIKLDRSYEIETAVGGTIVVQDQLVGNITGARLNGENIFSSFDDETNTITLDKAKLPTTAADMGAKDLIIDTDKAQYVAESGVYTKILRTADDILNWQNLAYAADDSKTYWGGYFVLGNDIDMAGKNFNGRFDYASMHNTTDWTVLPEYAGLSYRNGNTGGFRGVFDGRGFNIDNLNMSKWNDSFAGQLAAGGTVKNISFTNVTLGGAASLISCGGIGTIENVYAHIKSVAAGNAGNSDVTGVFYGQDTMSGARLYNCFAVFDSALSSSAGFTGLGAYHLGYGMLNGVYGVGLDPSLAIKKISSTGGGDVYGACKTYGDLIASGAEFDGWENEFWRVVNGIPYPKNLTLPEASVPSVSVDSEYVGAGGSFTVGGLSRYDVIELSMEAQAAGVKISGNRITVPSEMAKGTVIEFDVYSIFDKTKKQTLSVSVVESSEITLDGVYDVEIESGDTFEIDFGEYASKITGSLQSAVMDDAAFGSSSYSGGKLTLDTASLVGSWGEKTIVATFMHENNGVVESVTMVSVNVDIVTMIINDEAELNRFLDVAEENKIGNSRMGVFKLGNDIVCTGTYASHYVDGDTRGTIGVAAGFNGTFDGQGYTIYNLHTVGDRGGFVGPLGEHGVVKNVSFVNAKNTGNGAFIASNGCGTVENVYIQIDITPNSLSWNNASSVIVSDPFGQFRINNVIIEYINELPSGASSGYPVWNVHFGYGINNGVYAVGVDKYYGNKGEGDPANPADEYATYADWSAFEADGKSFEDWEGDFWTVEDGIPVPKKLVEKGSSVSIGNTELSVPVNSTVEIDTMGIYQKISLDAAAVEAGFTVKGNTVTVPETAAGKSFTVTVTSLIDGKTAEKTFKVVETENITVSETTEIDMTETGELTFDLTGYDIEGSVVSAKIDKTEFAEVSYEAGILTLDRETLGEYFGENNIVLTANVADGGTISKITTVNIPVLLVTKYIGTADELLKLRDYAVDVNGGVGGYFVQTADLDADGQRIGFGTWSNELNSWVDTFVGVYDGRGHVISDMTQGTNQGMFASINGGAVVKNVTFMNAVLNGNGGLIATAQYDALIENVVVYGSVGAGATGETWAPNGLIVSKAYENSVIRNCLVVVKDHIYTGTLRGGSIECAGMAVGDDQSKGTSVIEHVIAVNLKGGDALDDYVLPAIGTSDGSVGRRVAGTDRDTVHTFRGWEEYVAWAADRDLSAYAGDNWEILANKTPVTKAASVKELLKTADITNTTTNVTAGSVTVIEGSGWYALYSLETSEDGIAFENGAVRVPAGLAAVTFTVKAVSLLDSSVTDSVTFAVVENIDIAVSDTLTAEYAGDSIIEIDLNGYDVVGTLDSVSIAGKQFASPVYEGGIIKLSDKSALKSLMGQNEVIVVFKTERDGVTVSTCTVTVPVEVVTMIINDEAELNSMINLAKENAVGNSWYGYFVLGNDIYCEGNYASNYVDGDTRGNLGVAAGFNGILDGKGHAIYNLHTVGDRGGLVGPLGVHGVVRNISLVGAVNTGNGSLIASNGAGTVENVYISLEITPNALEWNAGSAVIVGDPYGNFRINKVIIDYVDGLPEDATSGYPMWNIHKGLGIVNGVYAVGVSKFYQNSGSGEAEGDVYGVYADWNEFKQADVDFSSWEGDFWNVDNGVPFPAALLSESFEFVDIDADVLGGLSYKLVTNTGSSDFAIEGETVGISIDGNRLIVDASAKDGDVVTVKATFRPDSAVTVTKTFTVRANEVVDLTGRSEIELNNSDKPIAEIDVTEAAAEGELVSVKLGSKTVGAALEGTTLKLTAADLGNAWGEQNLVMTVKITSGDAVSFKTVNIPVLIITKVLRTPDEVMNWNELSYAVDDANTFWSGYFVLGNDVDMSGKNYQGKFYYGNMHDTSTWSPLPQYAGLAWKNGNTGGFRGVFDGRGYTIDNLNVTSWTGSFAGQMAAGGVFKNVAFTNVVLADAASLVSVGGIGKIENVYAHVKSAGKGSANDTTGLFFSADTMAAARVVNCFAKFDSAPAAGSAGFTGLGSYHLGYGILSNVYAVGIAPEQAIKLLSDSGAGGDKYGAYSTADEFKAAVTVSEANGWDMSFWTSDADGLPIPVGLTE